MKVFLISLGCDKNLCDSEAMLGLLAGAGYELTDVEEEADIIIINTCSFIGDAKEESIETIIEAGQFKASGSCKKIVVTGCLAQRYADEIKSELPEVDVIVGTASFSKIVEAVGADAGTVIKDALDTEVHGNYPRISSTGGHYAYLKIAEGCDKCCSYCAIPAMRGSYRSVPIDELTSEAEKLVTRGASELILVAQETTLYGIDLYGKKSLPELISRLAKIEDLKWIRLLYCYPEEIDDELIDTIASEPKVVKYLDIPIQSASDAVLDKMGRLTNSADIRALVTKLRERIPDIALRTTLISGFPGESEADHQATLDFVREMRFDRLGVFAYSQEEGTRAAEMPGQIADEIKEKRRDEIMALQESISLEISESYIGKSLDAFVEGRLPDGETYAGRTYRDAPDVDGFIFFECPYELMSGSLVKLDVVDASEYDLIGELCNESCE